MYFDALCFLPIGWFLTAIGKAGASLDENSVDALTGLPDYDAFLRDIERMVAESAATGGPVSIALVDIDEFGKINDRHGQTTGDVIIKSLGESLVESIGSGGTVYRYGGDAFMILMEGIEKEQAFLRMERSRTAFEGRRAVSVNGKEVKLDLGISGGVAAFPDDANHRADLLRRCHEALYRAKVSGRNKVCLAREERMTTKTTHYTQGQLEGLSRLSKREGLNEAGLLREALDDLLRKRNA